MPDMRIRWLMLLILLALVGAFCCYQLRAPAPPSPQIAPRHPIIPELPDGWAMISLQVLERDAQKPMPARVTIVLQGPNGPIRMGMFRAKPGRDRVLRPRAGLLYLSGRAVPTKIFLPVGRYAFYATRGMEWSLDQMQLQVEEKKHYHVTLALHRELNTQGFVAADSHIHTRSFSNHGDITVQERMITIAGEGVELAIATDHNVNVDYAPVQKEMEMEPYFTTVPGNEVGSLQEGQYGHINIFPVSLNDPVPHPEFKDWEALLQDIKKTQASFSILNHPRWPLDPMKEPWGSFARIKLNRISGDSELGTQRFPFDAMELINADTAVSFQRSLPLYLFRDWFSLLNRGEKIPGVAGSDSHTAQVPVGQSRTYVRMPDNDPARIDVPAALQALRKGQSSVSLGIFVDMQVAGKYRVGDIAAIEKDKPISVSVRVASAGWIRPRTLLLFLNGQRIESQPIPSQPDLPTDISLSFSLKRPRHDAYLVAIALGEAVRTPPLWHGELMEKEGYTLGATNPIFLDVDSDGAYSAPRQTASQLLRQNSSANRSLQAFLRLFPQVEPVVGVQLLSLAQQRKFSFWKDALDKLATTHPLYLALQRSIQSVGPSSP